MTRTRLQETLVLFLGDIVCFNLALWPLLFFRYFGTRDEGLIEAHIMPFGTLFIIWAIVFFIAGLYEKRIVFFKKELLLVLLKSQLVNSCFAITLFYLVPTGIAPRANLFAYIIFSSILIFVWRLWSISLLGSPKKEQALLIGTGEDVEALSGEINNSHRHHLYFVDVLDPASLHGGQLERIMRDRKISTIVADIHNSALKEILPMSKLMEEGIRFIDVEYLYEEVFDRVPLSLVRYEWLIEHASQNPHFAYDFLKRISDIILGIIFSIITTPFFFLSLLLIKISSFGPAFISQHRVGERGTSFRLLKFRSWLFDDYGDQELHKKNKITKVGFFLRKTRLDELPQLINVIKGELSFIGPRPEIPKLVSLYEKEISYYKVRCLIKPGLSGWAQINDYDVPRGTPDVEKTKRKLSYDLFYVKHRSLLLDMKIALRTIQTLLSRSGA